MDHRRGCDQPGLQDVLVDQEWSMVSAPFKHLLAQEVFTPEYFGRLEHNFRWLLAKGLSDNSDHNRLSRNMSGYDAYGYCFPNSECGPFELFFGQEWHDLFARLFNVKTTGDIQVCLHHHRTGSLSGSIHNDLNPSWFPNRAPGTINVATDVHSRPNSPGEPGNKLRQVMRAISIILFLNNGPWEPGDGGETGFYNYNDQNIEDPVFAVPPLNNSLLAFECTPFSYHSFISNVNRPRNSLIMWLHRDFDEAIDDWGAENVVWWKR